MHDEQRAKKALNLCLIALLISIVTSIIVGGGISGIWHFPLNIFVLLTVIGTWAHYVRAKRGFPSD